jgi:DNA-binding response OmpR family regulator
MQPANILIIDDDYIVARTIERSLRSDEFRITLASRGEKGISMARQNPPDLIVLDIIMPEMDGYQVCRAIRADPALAHIPILFLTAKVKAQDKITGFNAGADDYLCKPFNVNELILRVQAILRRTRPATRAAGAPVEPEQAVEVALAASSHSLTMSGYVLDTRTFELNTPARGKVRLTPIQYDLVYHLMTHPHETFSPARLLDEVWDFPAGKGSPDLVRVHIKTLRERIEADPSAPNFIRTIPGRGYTVGPVPNADAPPK